MSIFTLLFVVLLVLKLLGLISISWWIVFAPLVVLVVLFTLLILLPIFWRTK
jgi:hypothetical protein